ncbi:unnamed protein product [Durusdinium trenchii]|uniref:Uncharacterized protein n=1 Tax=Durusdinium trenchii TaxID=1381693 RepID=A0ABP0SCL6_9DINO
MPKAVRFWALRLQAEDGAVQVEVPCGQTLFLSRACESSFSTGVKLLESPKMWPTSSLLSTSPQVAALWVLIAPPTSPGSSKWWAEVKLALICLAISPANIAKGSFASRLGCAFLQD